MRKLSTQATAAALILLVFTPPAALFPQTAAGAAGAAGTEGAAGGQADAAADIPVETDEDYRIFGEDNKGITVFGEEANPAVPERDVYGSRRLVTDGQLREQGSLDLGSALRNVPGVVVSQTNVIGAKNAASLYIHGRGSNHPSQETVTTFDDVPRNGAVWGQPMADAFPILAADSIEVYTAPQPSAFGAGLGLVNISPRFMRTQGWETAAGFSAGSFNTFSEDASFGFKRGAFDIFTAQSLITTEGHREHSGARQESYYANTGFAFTPNWGARALVNYVSSWTDNPPDEGDEPGKVRYETQSLLATATIANRFDNAEGYLKLYFDNVDFTILNEKNITGDYSKQPMIMAGVKIRETARPRQPVEFIAGFDMDYSGAANEQHEFNVGDNKTARTTLTQFPLMALYAPYLAASGRLGSGDGWHVEAQTGVRGYIHNIFESTAAPQAGITAGWRGTEAHFNYALGVVYPSPGLFLAFDFVSNIDALKKVKPEIAHHYEAGITHTMRGIFSVNAAFFLDDGRDRIIGSDSRNGVKRAANIAYFRISGIEAGASIDAVPNLTLWAGGTYLWVDIDDGAGKTAKRLPYSPKLSIQAGAKYVFLERFSVSADYQFLGGLYWGDLMFGAFTDYMQRLEDHHVLNARAAFSLSRKAWNIDKAEIFAQFNNILNRRREFRPDQPLPGFNFMAGLRITFK
ncbi:MAG: TonB-dependent receptor plug domain-containing protein [Spirochaetaceae bacterium]|jgi:iron complex outermembrane receptor protein|nr:TonB-dependent receptor plug domain-containing protein [Spirochaetaceae bacterium]